MGKLKRLPLIFFAYVLLVYPIYHSAQHSEIESHHAIEQEASNSHHHHHAFAGPFAEEAHHLMHHSHLDLAITSISDQYRYCLKKNESCSLYFGSESEISLVSLEKQLFVVAIRIRSKDPFLYRNRPLLI